MPSCPSTSDAASGEGTVWTAHGLLPVPAPAALRLMVGMPTCPGPPGITGELVTPTAAALLRVLTGVDGGAGGADHVPGWRATLAPGRPPNMVPRAIGVGAGTKDFARHPNVLRLVLGDAGMYQGRRKHAGEAEGGEIDGSVAAVAPESAGDPAEISEALISADGKTKAVAIL